MANRLQFLALFALLLLHATAARRHKHKNTPKDSDSARSRSIANDHFAKNNFNIGVVLPIMETSLGKSDFTKYYRYTMHMTDTNNHAFYSPKTIVTPWNGIKQVCPDPNNQNLYCENALLLVKENDWDRADAGYIIYLLEHVSEVDLIGHDVFDNKFEKVNLTGTSLIKGGLSTNTYDIEFADVYTLIYLNSASQHELISWANSYAAEVNLKFYAFNDRIHGELAFDSSPPARLECTNDYRQADDSRRVSWMISGLYQKPDKIECSNEEMIELIEGKIEIHAEGSGGNDKNDDIIINCMHSAFHPFTTYKFTYPGKKYQLVESYIPHSYPGNTESTIELKENVVEMFIGSPFNYYLQRLFSLSYSPWANTLTFEIRHPSGTRVMNLYVKGILKNYTINEFTGLNVFDDSQMLEYSTFSITREDEDDKVSEWLTPMIEKPVKFSRDTVVNITKFRLSTETDGTDLNDAMIGYQNFLAKPRDHQWEIEVMVKSKTGEEFYFGSQNVDNLWIVGQVMYIQGQNGADSLKLMEIVGDYVWIDNEANDGLYDTLLIDSEVCNDLKVEKHVGDHESVPRSKYDLALKCEKNHPVSPVRVVLMNYLKDKSYRHLKIMWDNVEYIILPEILISSDKYALKDSDTFSLGRVIDWKFPEAINHSIVEPTNLWILLNKEKISEIEAREENSNVVLFVKSMNLSIELKNFLKDGEILEEWRDKFFAVADDLSDESTKIQFLNLTLIN